MHARIIHVHSLAHMQALSTLPLIDAGIPASRAYLFDQLFLHAATLRIMVRTCVAATFMHHARLMSMHIELATHEQLKSCMHRLTCSTVGWHSG